MPWGFLNPWFWLGALAVAAPIWLHLRRRQETDLIRFSALRFLEDHPEPRRSPLRLRNLALLMIRVLALMLIIGGFAWPFVRGADTVPIKESRVYILDHTLSRQAQEGFNRDRDHLLGELARAGPEVQVAVIELTANPKVVTAFGDERPTARRKLDQLRPSFQRGSYLAAFRQAESLLENSFGETRRIVLLGDSQENQWHDLADTPPFLRNVQVDLPHPRTARLPNVSLAEPRVQRIFLGDRTLVSLTVKLTHLGEAKSANLTVRDSGRVVWQRTVGFQDQPESFLVPVQWEAEPGAWVRGEVIVESAPDALEADNRAFCSLEPVREGRLLLLAQSPYLRLALSPEVMRGQWATRVLDPAELAAEVRASEDAEVLCLESNFLQSAEARKLLWRYLTNGRGVLLVVNRLTPAIEGYLRELGFETDGTEQATPETPERFQFVFANHPVFHPFLSPDYGNLMDVRVWRYARLKGDQAFPLVFSEKGSALFFQSSRLPGKLFVTAFGLDRDHTSWPVHQTFIPFLDLTLQAARAQDPTPTSFEPGDLSTIQLPNATEGAELVLRGDQGEIARSPIEHGRAQLRLPDLPGLYTVTRGESGAVERVLSVNPPQKEFELVYREAPEVVKLWQLPNAVESARAPSVQVAGPLRLAGVLQQRWWWWMVLAGSGVLLVEMAMAGARKEWT